MQKIKNSEILQQNGITALSFSKNGAYCAIATKNNIKVYIFQIKTFNDINSWIILQEIKDHGQTISDIDWSLDQKLVTVSHDRSIYVWKKNKSLWEKMLVNLDIKLSILATRWAPSCKKFALATCPNSLTLSCFYPEIECWVKVFTKDKICKTSIVSIDFHPSNNLIAVGQVAGSIKIVTCSFKKNIEFMKLQDFTYSGPFEKIDSLGQVLFTIEKIFPDMNTWINYVSFEDNGKNLLVLPHSGHFKLFDVIQGEKTLINQRDIVHKGLPFLNGLMNVEKSQLVMAGFDRKVAIFTKSGESYRFEKYLQSNEKTNKKKIKGIVQIFTKGIQKKQWQFGDHPREDEHRNIVKVFKVRNNYVSYDINGIIHFWQ